MTPSTHELRAIVLSVILSCIFASVLWADRQDTGAPHIAIANPKRLEAEYKFAKSSRGQIKKIHDEQLLKLRTWDTYHMLSRSEQDALTRLVLKEAATPNKLTTAERERMQDLKNKHEMRLKQYNDLLNTGLQPRNVVSLQKFRSDTAQYIRRQDRLWAIESQSGRESKNDRKIETDIHNAVKKVARKKRLIIVLSKEVLPYADIDITEDVLRELNK